MAQAARTSRIMASSTFSDLKEERNVLQEMVFSCVGELYLQHQARFQAIDLRWGARKEAEVDQWTLRRGENAPLRV